MEYEEKSKNEKDELLKTDYNDISMSSYAETNRLISSLTKVYECQNHYEWF